jgi:DNA-binding YbaB/EbfC family protein
MKNLGNMMKQAQQMQERMAEMQASLDRAEMTGSAAAGMVTVTLTGKNDLRKIHIDKSLVDPDEVEVLEDLILAAFADAKQKVEQFAAEEMAKVTGGLSLPPGFKLPF